MAKVLTLKFGAETIEVHMLNPGDVFDGFGGSRHSLIVGRHFATGARHKRQTASLVTRRLTAMGLEDYEKDIFDPAFWASIARLIRGEGNRPDDAIGPVEESAP